MRLAPGSAGACRRVVGRVRADGDPATRSGGAEGAGRPDGRGPGRVARHAGVGHRRRPGRHGPRDAAAAGRQGRPRPSPSSRRRNKPDPPDYALLAATRAYRDLGRYDEAARLARDGARRFPGESVWPLLLSLVLSDAGRTAEALELLRTPAAQRALAGRAADGRGIRLPPRRQSCRCAQGLWRGGAAVARQSRRAQRGGRRPARHGRALRRRDDRRQRRGRSRRNRPAPWCAGARRSGRPTRRAASTAPMRRCAKLDALLASLPADDKALRRRLRLDRLVALRDRVRMKEAMEEGDALSADGALARLCRAGLRRCPALHAPARGGARCLQPHPGAVTQGRGGALRRLLRLRRARGFHGGLRHHRFAGQRRAGLALLSRRSDAATPIVERGYAETTAAQARFYGNQLGEAWDRLVRLSDAAPANANTRLALYQVANARGWPRRARRKPRSPPAWRRATSAAASPWSRRRSTPTASPTRNAWSTSCWRSTPRTRACRRLARDLDAKRRWLLDVKVQPSNSDGGGANASGQAIAVGGAAVLAADRRQLAAVRARRLFQRPSARGLRAARPGRRRPRMAHPLADRDRLSDAVVGHAGQGRRRRHGRLVGDRPDRARRLGRAVLGRHAAARAAVRHHRRRVFRQGDVPLARIAQHRRELRLSAVHRRQPARSPAASPTRNG